MNTSAPGDHYCFTMESAIARQVHATAAATAALDGDQAKVVVENGLKECLGNYRDNKRASNNSTHISGGNNCDGTETESSSAAPRKSAAKAIEQLANLDLRSSSGQSAITGTTKVKPEKDSHKKLQSAIQNLSDHVDDTLNKTGTKNSHNKTNGSYSSDEDSLDYPPERRRTSAFISCLAEKIPENVEKKFGSKQQQEWMHQSLPHLDAADIKEYLLGGSVHRAKNTMAKGAKGQRQTTHKQREMAHFLNTSFTRHGSNDDDNANYNNNNNNALDQSWTELFEKGAESKAATEAALKVMGTATMLEKLGKSPRLLREITAELAGFGGGGGDGSVSSIHTFDLHNLSHGDNLLVVPSDDEGREEDEVNIDTSDEGENEDVKEEEQGGPLDIDIDIDIDVEDTKNKKKLKKKILNKKQCGHKNKKTEGSSKSKSPPRASGKQKQQPKGTPSNGSNFKSGEDSGDPGFFAQFPDFEEDPFAPPFDDPFADEIIAEAAPFRRSATTPVPTSTSGGSSNGQGFRRAGTRDQILARKKNIVGTGRSRARPGRIRDANKTDINFAAYSAANQNGGDGDTIGQGDDDAATQSATNSDAGLEAKLGQLKKKTLKRGPSVSTVIANKIRSNPDLLEQFLDMVKDDQTFHAALECGVSGPSPLNGMDTSSHAQQRSADIKPGTYRSMLHGGDAASVASSVVSGAAPIGPSASNVRRSRRNRVSISETGITRPEPGAGGAPSPLQAPEPSALDRRRGRHAMKLMEESTRKKIGGES